MWSRKENVHWSWRLCQCLRTRHNFRRQIVEEKRSRGPGTQVEVRSLLWGKARKRAEGSNLSMKAIGLEVRGGGRKKLPESLGMGRHYLRWHCGIPGRCVHVSRSIDTKSIILGMIIGSDSLWVLIKCKVDGARDDIGKGGGDKWHWNINKHGLQSLVGKRELLKAVGKGMRWEVIHWG